jgi:putative transposase
VAFWEQVIGAERDYKRQVDYLQYYPLKPGQVARVADWPHSSFQQKWRDALRFPALHAANQPLAQKKPGFCHITSYF